MGIINKGGALYMATGIDNSQMYVDKQEAMGIIKAMASEVTSFDIFSGIGISAATAFAQAAKEAYDFEKEFRSNMGEVSTISREITQNMADYMNQVIDITKEIPITAPEAAKALYQIVSAGHDGAEGMKILEVSAKSAIAGITDTTTAADAITTIINAYKMSADDAEKVSDQLFTTVRLGKTTFGELGKYIAQAAPIAASYGIEIDQLLATIASLTKQGTPTAQAMTQIRAAIIGVSKVLGDGAFDGRTFQDALQLVADKANGSQSKLRKMIPEVEAVNGVLEMTGKNAAMAASDLSELQNSTGATEDAFGKMKEEAGNQLKLLSNNVHAALRPMGQEILKQVSDMSERLNEAFKNGDVQKSLQEISGIAKIAAGSFLSYRTAVLLVNAAQNLNTKSIALNRLAAIKNVTVVQLLTTSLRAQAVAMLAAAKATLVNPYVLAAAAVAALGYAVYKLATQATASEIALNEHNKRVRELKDWAEKTKSTTDELVNVIRSENESNLKKIEAYNELQKLYPNELKNMSLQKFLLLDVKNLNDLLADSINKRKEAQQRADVNNIESEMSKNSSRIDQLTKNAWANNISLTESLELRKLKKRNEELKIEYDKAVQIVVEGFKNRTKAEALGDSESGKSSGKIPLSPEELDKIKKQHDKELKLKEDLAQAILDNEVKLQAAINATMEDGKAKRIAMAKQEASETIAAIQKEKSDYLDKVREGNGKPDQSVLTNYSSRETEAKNKETVDISLINKEYDEEYKRRNKALTDLFLNEEQRKLSAIKYRYEQERKWASDQLKTGGMTDTQYKDYSNNIDIAQTKETMDTLLESVDDYKKREKEINDKWNADIDAANDARDVALVERLMKGKEKALSELNGQMLQQSEAWQQLFGDLDTLTSSQIHRLVDIIKSKAKDLKLNPVDLKAVTDSLDKAEETVIQRNPFAELGKSFKAVFKDASKDSNKDSKDIKTDWKNLASSAKGSFDFINDAVNSCGALSDILGESGKQTLSIIQNITMAGIGLAQAISTAEKASIVLAAISAALAVVTAVFSMVDKAHEVSQKTIDAYNALIKVIDNVIDKHKELMEELSGTSAVNEYNTSIDLINKQIEATRKLGLEYLDSNAKHSHTYGYKLRQSLQDYAKDFNSVGISWSSIYGTGRMEGLFSLSADQLRIIQEKLPEAWAHIDEKTRGYLQTIIDCDDKASELSDTLNQSLNQVSFDDMYSSYLDTLLDMDSDSQTLASNLEKYMQKAILKSMLDGKYKDRLKTWYTNFTEANSDSKITLEEASALRQEWKDISDAAIAERNAAKDLMGWTSDSTSSSDNSLKGAYAKASQESIDLLAGQEGAKTVILGTLKDHLANIRDMQSKGWEDVRAIRDLTDKINNNTNQIADNSKTIYDIAKLIYDYTKRTSDALENKITVKVQM